MVELGREQKKSEGGRGQFSRGQNAEKALRSREKLFVRTGTLATQTTIKRRFVCSPVEKKRDSSIQGHCFFSLIFALYFVQMNRTRVLCHVDLF